MPILRQKQTAKPTPEETKGVRRFTYEVDLDKKDFQPGELPYKCTFEGQWSRHAVDTMLKHAIKALRQHKRNLLKEALNDRAE